MLRDAVNAVMNHQEVAPPDGAVGHLTRVSLLINLLLIWGCSYVLLDLPIYSFIFCHNVCRWKSHVCFCWGRTRHAVFLNSHKYRVTEFHIVTLHHINQRFIGFLIKQSATSHSIFHETFDLRSYAVVQQGFNWEQLEALGTATEKVCHFIDFQILFLPFLSSAGSWSWWCESTVWYGRAPENTNTSAAGEKPGTEAGIETGSGRSSTQLQSAWQRHRKGRSFLWNHNNKQLDLFKWSYQLFQLTRLTRHKARGPQLVHQLNVSGPSEVRRRLICIKSLSVEFHGTFKPLFTRPLRMNVTTWYYWFTHFLKENWLNIQQQNRFHFDSIAQLPLQAKFSSKSFLFLVEFCLCSFLIHRWNSNSVQFIWGVFFVYVVLKYKVQEKEERFVIYGFTFL